MESKTFHIDLTSRYGGDMVEAIWVVEAVDEEDARMQFKDQPWSFDWYIVRVVECEEVVL